MAQLGYYQQPSLHRDTLVFVSEDDLWAVPASGGTARRLTANPGRASAPALSPDGAWLAFNGRDEGSDEVYLMPAEGGPARRLTFLGARSRVVGWTPDGRIVFASDARDAFPGHSRLYALAPEGGEPSDLGVGHAVDIAFGGAARVLARNATDIAQWKRYRGGLTGDLWIDPDGSGTWRRLVQLDGNVAAPMILGERVLFVSDHEGTGNLYSCTFDGGDVRRHTEHEDFYVRHPASDGERVAYQAGADLYLLDPAAGGAQRVPIDLASPRTQRARRFVEASRFLQHAALDAEGKQLTVTTRGQVFSLPAFDGTVERHGTERVARQRLAAFLRDGRIVAVSDAAGRDRLELYRRGGADAAPERVYDGLDVGRPVRIVPAPERPQVAIDDHAQRLLLVDLEAGEGRELDSSRYGRIGGMAFSPDGAWLAYSIPVGPATAIVRLVRLETGERFDATDPVLQDAAPAFDPEGRYLYFLGARTFDPVYDEVHFELGFPRAVRPYLVTLQADARSPFADGVGFPDGGAGGDGRRKPDGAGAAPAAAGGTGGAEGGSGPAPVRIDVEGLSARIAPVPLPVGRYGRVLPIAGKLLYTTYPIEGSLSRNFLAAGAPPARGTLHALDLATRESEVLMDGITDARLSADRSTVLVRAGNRLRVFKAGEKAPADPRPDPGRKSAWIDLGRARVSIDPPAEWEQMLRETWQLQRELFWTEDMAGLDWEAVLERYRPLVERVGTRSEMSDLLWEVQGELGTSHAYILGGDLPPEPSYPLGYLGADLRWDEDADAWAIERVLQGDVWDDGLGSPLARPGVNAGPGDRIVAINGQRVGRDAAPGTLLVHQARSEVRLTIEPAGGGERRDVHVRTLGSEVPLRYRAWVEANRRRVHEASGGRLGYLHIPDMGPRGYAEFHRGWLLEAHRDGLVVDVRFNGGGHVSELVLEKLARRRLAYSVPRYGEPQPYPQQSVAGPLIAITNERAGSDGDIFSHLFKRMGLGPLVGTRTWGGVIGINVTDGFLDGGISTQPQYAFWFDDVGWRVENFGTEPTVPVEIAPHDDAAGRDPQLERAMQEGLAALEAQPPRKPDLSGRPSRAVPPLPKRGGR